MFCQVISAQNKTVNIECLLTINDTDWKKNSRLMAQVTVINNSENEIEMILTPQFNLDKKDIPLPNPNEHPGFGKSYYSHEVLRYVQITKNSFEPKKIEPRQEFSFSLNKLETKTVEFDLSKLVWKDWFSSIDGQYTVSGAFTEPDNLWFGQIKSGKYDLYFSEDIYLSGEDNKKSIEIVSNKVEVNLNSEK